MWEQIEAFIDTCFSGAPLPASVLLFMALCYWILAILVGLDFDLFDFDVDADLDAESGLHSLFGLGFLVLRFFNIGRVPLMIWGSVFVVLYWLTSMLLDRLMDDPATREQMLYAVQHGIRNFVVAMLATKFVTHPLRDKFEAREPNRPEDLIGRTCVVLTSEVTESFGQAEVQAEGAPLKLNVRTQVAALTKGDVAIIVGFDAEHNLYSIEPTDPEV